MHSWTRIVTEEDDGLMEGAYGLTSEARQYQRSLNNQRYSRNTEKKRNRFIKIVSLSILALLLILNVYAHTHKKAKKEDVVIQFSQTSENAMASFSSPEEIKNEQEEVTDDSMLWDAKTEDTFYQKHADEKKSVQKEVPDDLMGTVMEKYEETPVVSSLIQKSSEYNQPQDTTTLGTTAAEKSDTWSSKEEDDDLYYSKPENEGVKGSDKESLSLVNNIYNHQVMEDDFLPDFMGDTIDSLGINKEKPKVIALLAERNSGLEWLFPKLVECFPDVKVTTSLTRKSPWFQSPKNSDQLEPTFAITLFINPYSWIDIMRKDPLHAPNHADKDWFSFVTSSWTMDRPEDDINSTECQYQFSYDEVMPCEKIQTLNGDHAVYEMKCRLDKCEPYKNIIQLRADKIKNFLSIAEWENIVSLLPVQYESLTSENGFATLVSTVEKHTGTKTSCTDTGLTAPVPPSTLEGVDKDEFRTWMIDNVDWGKEYTIGYDVYTKDEDLWGSDIIPEAGDRLNDQEKSNILKEDSTVKVAVQENDINHDAQVKSNTLTDSSNAPKLNEFFKTPEVVEGYDEKIDSTFSNFDEMNSKTQNIVNEDGSVIIPGNKSKLDADVTSNTLNEESTIEIAEPEYHNTNPDEPAQSNTLAESSNTQESINNIETPEGEDGSDKTASSLVNDIKSNEKMEEDFLSDFVGDTNESKTQNIVNEEGSVIIHDEGKKSKFDAEETSNTLNEEPTVAELGYNTNPDAQGKSNTLTESSNPQESNNYSETPEGEEGSDKAASSLVNDINNHEKMEEDYLSDLGGDTIDLSATNKDKPKVIALIAERNSGLEWLFPKLVECFPDVKVTTSLTRQSPWFQSPKNSDQLEPTFAITLFINPYSWIDIMRKDSLHAPNHVGIDWFSFVTSSWTMDRPEDDINSTECQYQFSYDEVMPCEKIQTLNGDHAVYEMKCRLDKCEPYKNIIQLRADKIKNFLSIAEWDNIVSFLPVMYESLTAENGFATLVSKVEGYTGTKASCTDTGLTAPVPPSTLEGVDKDEFRTWMIDNVDWKEEYAIGYDVYTKDEDLWGSDIIPEKANKTDPDAQEKSNILKEDSTVKVAVQEYDINHAAQVKPNNSLESLNIQESNDYTETTEDVEGNDKESSSHVNDINNHQVMEENISDFVGDTIDSSATNKDKPKVIALIAERNSGLEWLFPKLVECFLDIEVTTSLTRKSPWFQSPKNSDQLEPTFAITLFINPYSWIDIMRKDPLHAPNHADKDWFSFVTSSWTMDRPEDDINSTECQYQFSYDEVMPCEKIQTLNADHAVYEMKCRLDKCEPYKNIIQLRADKIKNFLSIAEWDNIVSLLPVMYESLTAENGFATLVSKVEGYTGTKASCTDTGLTAPVPSTTLEGVDKDEFRTWMIDNVDWDEEYVVGYEQDMKDEELWG